MSQINTLKGKNNWLFLINDSSKSLDKHMHNKFIPSVEVIQKKSRIPNFFMIIFPNKEVICKEFLPDNIKINYRTHLDMYKNIFKERLLEPTSILDPSDYYITDTHINCKGNLKIFNYFLKFIGLDVKNIKLEKFEVDSLSNLGKGIGDLTWEQNKQNLVLDNINDIYYKLPSELEFYMTEYKPDKKNFIILDYNLNKLSRKYNVIDWNVVSKNIFYYKHCESNIDKKVIFFYDSFLLSSIGLYKNIFKEIYFIKDLYNQALVNKIKPDLIFEFRVERFL